MGIFKEAFSAQEKERVEFKKFKDRIAELASQEKIAGGTAHFKDVDFNTDDLVLHDMYAWKKVEDKTITRESFLSYAELVKMLPGTDSRSAFRSLIANKAGIIIGERQLAEETG